MGTKTVASCKNIYDIDLLTLTNQITKRGVVEGMVMSAGLHVHFSSKVVVTIRRPNLRPHSFPLRFGEGVVKEVTFYEKVGMLEGEEALSRITIPVIRHFVTCFDKDILPKYKIVAPKKVKEALKYRKAGYYEVKSYGFEYRSLPFTEEVLADLVPIVNYAFDLLEGL